MSDEFARDPDFKAHLKAGWKDAHQIWLNVKAYIDARALVQITAVDITSLFTWDGGQHTLDLTSLTSATARWAEISYYVDRNGGDVIDPLKFRTVGGTVDLIRLCGDKHNINTADGSIFYPRYGWCGRIPLDANQAVDYITPAAWTTRAVYLLGYSG